MVGASWCAAASARWSRAGCGGARSCSIFRAMGRRSIAPARPSTKPPPRCAKAKPSSISSSSRAVTRNRSATRRGPGPTSTAEAQGVEGALLSFASPPRYTRSRICRRGAMSDMRLIVAGAGGRMGRPLGHALAATDGALPGGRGGAAAPSGVIGREAGGLAGLGKNGVAVTTDIEPLLAQADGLIDFTVPAATIAFAEHTARKGCVHVIGTTGLTGENEKLIEQ